MRLNNLNKYRTNIIQLYVMIWVQQFSNSFPKEYLVWWLAALKGLDSGSMLEVGQSIVDSHHPGNFHPGQAWDIHHANEPSGMACNGMIRWSERWMMKWPFGARLSCSGLSFKQGTFTLIGSMKFLSHTHSMLSRPACSSKPVQVDSDFVTATSGSTANPQQHVGLSFFLGKTGKLQRP